MSRVTITPHSTDPSAVAATIDTLRMQHGAGFEHVETRDGKICGTSSNARYLKWAAERQGYCLLVEIEGDDHDLVMQVLAEQARRRAEVDDADARGWCRKLAETPSIVGSDRPRGMDPKLAVLALRPKHLRLRLSED